MPCPFPGMDPFLERPPYWGDFAQKLLARIGDELLAQVFPDYEVCLEEYVLVMSDGEPLHRVRPDVAITETPSWQQGGGNGTATATAIATQGLTCVELDYPNLEPEMQRHINVIHREDNRVVTVMELLSPGNKRPGEEAFAGYLAKRNELIGSDVNLLEIDLLRGGKRLPMRGRLPAADYYAFVGRGHLRPHCEVIYWTLPSKLPMLSIPLLPKDGDAQLDLSTVFNETYERGIFDQRLPYHEPLQPKPDEALQKWIDECLAKRKL